MIAITDKTVIGELQHWFHEFVIEASINKYLVPPPTKIGELFLKQKCFLELLFNKNYSESDYRYNFVEATWGCSPAVVTRRIQVYPGAKYVKQGFQAQDGEDIFNLRDEEKSLLDALLSYTLDSTSVTIVETPSNTISFDSTSMILVCNYDALWSSLSKLIFLYLDLKINGNTDRYDNTDLISNGGLLNSMYELFVINEFFKSISEREPTLIHTT